MKFNNALSAFNRDFSNFASRNATTGQEELRYLSEKLVCLENTIVQYVICLVSNTGINSNSRLCLTVCYYPKFQSFL